MLHDKSIDDVSIHRRAEALMAIADIFTVSGHLHLSNHEIWSHLQLICAVMTALWGLHTIQDVKLICVPNLL